LREKDVLVNSGIEVNEAEKMRVANNDDDDDDDDDAVVTFPLWR